MASIFGGTPFLDFGYQRPQGGNEFFASFMEGVKTKDRREEQRMERERLGIAKEHEARAAQLFPIEQRIAQSKEQLLAYQLKSAIRDYDNLVDDEKVLVSLGQKLSEIAANPLDLNLHRDFEKIAAGVSPDNPGVVKLMNRYQWVVERAQRIQEVDKLIAGRKDVAETRSSGSGGTALSKNLDVFYDAVERDDDMAIDASIEALGLNRDRRSSFQKNLDAYRAERGTMSPEDRQMWRRQLKSGVTAATEAKIETGIMSADRAIADFENMLKGAKLSNWTIGPAAFVSEKAIDPIIGLLGDEAYEKLGAGERTAARTELRKSTLAAVRQIIDDTGNLTEGERKRAQEVVGGLDFLSTAPEVRTQLRTLIDIFKGARERNLGYLQSGIGGSKPEQSIADLEAAAKSAISREGANSAEARRLINEITKRKNALATP